MLRICLWRSKRIKKQAVPKFCSLSCQKTSNVRRRAMDVFAFQKPSPFFKARLPLRFPVDKQNTVCYHDFTEKQYPARFFGIE